jgi:predicted DsbA family dithiol-disulfide isomerase
MNSYSVSHQPFKWIAFKGLVLERERGLAHAKNSAVIDALFQHDLYIGDFDVLANAIDTIGLIPSALI